MAQRILAIDTATRLSGVALCDGPEAVWVSAGRPLARGEALTEVIRRALAETGWSGGGLDGIAVSTGPGSYTGLRIGLAVAKALAWAWSVPLVGVGTLEAQAWLGAWAGEMVLAALDAGHGEVFGALYQVVVPAVGSAGLGPAALQPVLSPDAMRIDALADSVSAWAARAGATGRRVVVASGDGCRRHADRLGAVAGAEWEWVWVPPAADMGRAVGVGMLAGAALAQGRRDDPVTLGARYLKATEAERRWQLKKNR